ncbi:MAG: phosphate transporter permease [Mycobacterium sp.]|nr:phosphate transporter permease [Mycobacterium sp.]
MTTTAPVRETPEAPLVHSTLRGRTLPRWALPAVAVVVAAVTYGLFQVTPMQGRADGLVVWAVLFLVAAALVARVVEGPRQAKNRLLTLFVGTCFVIAMLPLVAVVAYTVQRGLKRFDGAFLTHSMAYITPLSPAGGAYHAIIGTLEQVLLAGVIAVPLGMLVAIYTMEYGGRGLLARTVTFFIDVMTGVPSIVAGLFIFAFWVLGLGMGFSGFAGSLALAILMLPVVVRSTEEMIRLVPASLREASYALGVPRWKTILHIVLPTAKAGIVTGVMLAVARVIGETAPLLLTVGDNSFINTDPFSGQQASLSLFVFQQVRSGAQFNVDRAWAGALALILLVLVLNLIARLITRRSSVGRR